MSHHRIFLLSLVIFALVLAGLVALNGRYVALSIPFVFYLAASLRGQPEELRLKVERQLSSERVGVGQPVQVSVTVTNHGAGLEEVVIEDRLPVYLEVTAGSPRHMLQLPAGQTVSWSYTLTGMRGFYRFESIFVKACGTFGLTHKTANLPTSGQLFILPPVLRLKNIAIRPRRTRVYSGIVPAHIGGPGVEFFGMREYQPGDPLRWINWQASARHPMLLFSKEFEQERVADVGIVLDGRQRANLISTGHSIFEHSALAAATLADAFLSHGNRVSLLIYGRYIQWTLPGYGKVQREKILRALAQAQIGFSQVFADLDHIPTRLFPANSQVVLVSPLSAGDADVVIRLRARGYQVMLVSPDPVAFEMAFLPENKPEIELAARVVRLQRELMLQRIKHAGIQVIPWDVQQAFDQVMNTRAGKPPVLLNNVRVTQ